MRYVSIFSGIEAASVAWIGRRIQQAEEASHE